MKKLLLAFAALTCLTGCATDLPRPQTLPSINGRWTLYSGRFVATRHNVIWKDTTTYGQPNRWHLVVTDSTYERYDDNTLYENIRIRRVGDSLSYYDNSPGRYWIRIVRASNTEFEIRHCTYVDVSAGILNYQYNTYRKR
jgi:hypothetical protein